MKDLSKEVLAYALQNAIEHGKADAGKILPKLFQHGLEKHEIESVKPVISKAVNHVNGMDADVIVREFDKLKGFVKKRKDVERRLPSLPGSPVAKKPVFRLAPFPSGALHIGNAKTYVLNALYAEEYNGKILLVMDDTIGSAEKPLTKEAYKLIEEAFQWLGVKYSKPVIYKSDRLKIYYKYAEKILKLGKAYVCICKQEKFKKLLAIVWKSSISDDVWHRVCKVRGEAW